METNFLITYPLKGGFFSPSFPITSGLERFIRLSFNKGGLRYKIKHKYKFFGLQRP